MDGCEPSQLTSVMASDIIPQSVENSYNWLLNLDLKIQTHGAKVGMTPADITAFRAEIAPLIAKLKTTLDAQHALDLASGQSQQEAANRIPGLRRRLQNIKTSAGYDDGIGADLGILATSTTFNAETYQPEATSAESSPLVGWLLWYYGP